MDDFFKQLKWGVYFFSLVILFQSCTVYRSNYVSSKEAVEANTKVKAVTIHDHTYKFKYLTEENGKLYGIAKKNSTTAKQLNQNAEPLESSNNLVKILIPEDSLIDKYRIKNKTASTLWSVLIGPVVLLVGGMLFAGFGGLDFN